MRTIWHSALSGLGLRPVFAAIDRAHDGLMADYVVWILIGLTLFAVSSAAALHAT